VRGEYGDSICLTARLMLMDVDGSSYIKQNLGSVTFLQNYLCSKVMTIMGCCILTLCIDLFLACLARSSSSVRYARLSDLKIAPSNSGANVGRLLFFLSKDFVAQRVELGVDWT